MRLRPHQEKNVALLFEALKKHGGALDASDTGVGKSGTFVGLCKMLGAKPGIITRKAIIPGWVDTCKALDVEPAFIANYEKCQAESFEFGKASVKTVGTKKHNRYEWFPADKRVILCFDEVQACRSPSTMNSRMLLEAADKFKTVMLSATPFTSPLEAAAIGRALRLFDEKGYYRWLHGHAVKKNHFGRMEFAGDMPSENSRRRGLEAMDRINASLFPERGCRTRRSEIPGFPETLIIPMEIETGETTAIEAVYLAELEERRKADWAKAQENIPEEFHDLVAPLPITMNLRARQEVELLKVPSFVELAREASAQGEAVAIFVNFDHTIEALCEHLKTNCVVRGKSRGRRDENPTNCVKSFQSNNAPFIILNNAAGGAGISLQDYVTQKPRTSIISPPYSAVMLRQILGRPQRLGGGFSTQKLCFASGTIEMKVMRRVQASLQNLDHLLDSDLDPVSFSGSSVT